MEKKETIAIRDLYYKLFGKKSDDNNSKDDILLISDPRYISLQSDDRGQPIWQENKLG